MTDSLREYRKLYNKTRGLALEYNIANVVQLDIIGWCGGNNSYGNINSEDNDTISISTHQILVTGTPIIFSNNVVGANPGTTYYVVNLFMGSYGNYFSVSLTPNGSVATLPLNANMPPNTGIGYYNSSTYLMELKDVIAERVQMLRGLQWGSVGFLQDPSFTFGTETFIKSENKKLLKNFADLMPQWGGPGNDMAHSGRSVFSNTNLGNGGQIFKVPDYDGSSVTSGLAIGTDGTIYFGTIGYFYAISPSGELVWWNTQQAGNSDYIGNPVLDTSGNIYVKYYDTDTLYKFSKTGKALLNVSSIGSATPAIGRDGTLYVMNNDNSSMIALNPDGKTKWDIEMNNYSVQPAIGYVDGVETLYVGCAGGYVYSINASNGYQNWAYLTTSGSSINCPPVLGSNGIVYVGSTDNYVYAVNGRTGLLIWKFQSEGDIKSLALGQNGYVYAASNDKKIYALKTIVPGNSASWIQNVGDSVIRNLSQDSDGNIYLTSNGQIHGYTRAGISLSGFDPYPNFYDCITSPVIYGNYLFVATSSSLKSLNITTGDTYEAFPNGVSSIINSDPVANSSSVYYIANNVMYQLSHNLGSSTWTIGNITLLGSTSFSAPLKLIGNVVYVGSEQGIVYGVDASNGTLVFQSPQYNDPIYGGAILNPTPVVKTITSISTSGEIVPTDMSGIYPLAPIVFSLSIDNIDSGTTYYVSANFVGSILSTSFTLSTTSDGLTPFTPDSTHTGLSITATVTLNAIVFGSGNTLYAVNSTPSELYIYTSDSGLNSVTGNNIIISGTGTSIDGKSLTMKNAPGSNISVDSAIQVDYTSQIALSSQSSEPPGRNTAIIYSIFALQDINGEYPNVIVELQYLNGYSVGSSFSISGSGTEYDTGMFEILTSYNNTITIANISGDPVSYINPKFGIVSDDTGVISTILSTNINGDNLEVYVINPGFFVSGQDCTISGTGTALDGRYTNITITTGFNPLMFPLNGVSGSYTLPPVWTLTNDHTYIRSIILQIDNNERRITVYASGDIGSSGLCTIYAPGSDMDGHKITIVGNSNNVISYTEDTYTTQYTTSLFPLVTYDSTFVAALSRIQSTSFVSNQHIGNNIYTTPVVDSSKNIYFGDDSGTMNKISSDFLTSTPSPIVGGQIRSSPIISDDGLTIYFGSTNNRIWSIPLNDFDNSPGISYTTNSSVNSSPIFDHVTKYIYIGDNSGNVYCINLGPTRIIPHWTYDFNTINPGDIPGDIAIGGDGTVYVAAKGASTGYTVSFTKDGQGINLMDAPTNNNTMFSPVIGSNGTLYVASISGISAFN